MKEKRHKLLAYIIHYKRLHNGNSPSVREIQHDCGYASIATIVYALRELSEGGLIMRPTNDGKWPARSIEIDYSEWIYYGPDAKLSQENIILLAWLLEQNGYSVGKTECCREGCSCHTASKLEMVGTA